MFNLKSLFKEPIDETEIKVKESDWHTTYVWCLTKKYYIHRDVCANKQLTDLCMCEEGVK